MRSISRHTVEYHIKLPRSIALWSQKENSVLSDFKRGESRCNLVSTVTLISSFIKIPWQFVFFFPPSLRRSIETTIERHRDTIERSKGRKCAWARARTHHSRNFYSAARNSCAIERRAGYCSVILDARVWRVSHTRGFLIAVTQRAQAPPVFLPLKSVAFDAEACSSTLRILFLNAFASVSSVWSVKITTEKNRNQRKIWKEERERSAKQLG